MTKLHQEKQAEPFFITEEVEAELIAAGYAFAACSAGSPARRYPRL